MKILWDYIFFIIFLIISNWKCSDGKYVEHTYDIYNSELSASNKLSEVSWDLNYNVYMVSRVFENNFEVDHKSPDDYW